MGSFISAFSGCFLVFILWDSLVNRNEILGSYGASRAITSIMLSPIAYHNNFFTYYFSVDYTYGQYFMD